MLYFYSVTLSKNDLNEISGLLEADTKDSAVKIILASGLNIREVRLANQNDIRIWKLREYEKNIKRKLYPSNFKSAPLPSIKFSEDSTFFQRHKLILIGIGIVLIGLIIWTFLRGQHGL